MRKILSVLICLMMLLSCAAFAAEEAQPAFAMTGIAAGETVLGDILAAGLPMQAFSCTEDGEAKAAFVFSDGPALLSALGTAEQVAKLNEIDAMEFDFDELTKKQQLMDEIYAEFVITDVTDLSENVIPQDELDSFVGRSVSEALEAGFGTYEVWCDPEKDEAVFELVNKGFYRYAFLADCDEEVFEKVQDTDAVYDLTVKSASFAGLTYEAVSVDEEYIDVMGSMEDALSDGDLDGMMDQLLGMLPEGTDLSGLTPEEILELILQSADGSDWGEAFDGDWGEDFDDEWGGSFDELPDEAPQEAEN